MQMMRKTTRFALLALAALAVLAGSDSLAGEQTEAGFTRLDDGETFEGWKMSDENQDSWSVENGAFKANGPRSHLFYVDNEKPFVNFELKVDVMTRKNSNGGIYFHTEYQPEGWPKHGFEVQVNNSYHRDPRKTGSLYAVKDVNEAPAEDNEWFTEHVIVKGRNVVVKVDGKEVVNYTEPKGRKAGKNFTRKLTDGTFALQAHDPGSTVYYRNIRVKRLD